MTTTESSEDYTQSRQTRVNNAAPAPLPADVGIVAALSIEVGFLLDRLAKVRKYSGPKHTIIEGELGSKLVVVIIAGMGSERIRQGAQLLLDGHRPRWIFSVGFAGALNPELARLDLVLADEVLDLESGRFAIDVAIPSDSRFRSVHTGKLLTVDQIIATAAEKAELRSRTGADIVDMESSAVASLCSERSIRFLSIRVVSDDARSDLPPEVVSMLTQSGSYRVGAALRALWKRPSSIKDFWALHEHAQEAADRLATFTAEAIGQID
ncbi:nucleoside phosphorylase [Singulisphaera sp. PoT]|uniref:phosphorylase family protein n=1 Tax=Singulisphaera sp. PoT TaxID=3411797 RepID=UPI003BF5067A